MKVVIKKFFTSIFKSSIFLGVLYFSKIPLLIWASKILFLPLFITCCTDLIKNASKKQLEELKIKQNNNTYSNSKIGNNYSNKNTDNINYLKEVKKSLGNSDQLNKSKVLKKTKV